MSFLDQVSLLSAVTAVAAHDHRRESAARLLWHRNARLCGSAVVQQQRVQYDMACRPLRISVATSVAVVASSHHATFPFAQSILLAKRTARGTTDRSVCPDTSLPAVLTPKLRGVLTVYPKRYRLKLRALSHVSW